MQRRFSSAVLLLVWTLLLAACQETPTSTPDSPWFAIWDAVHGGGNRSFYWLPPMITSMPAVSGVFDATMDPEVNVCKGPVSGCATPMITFTAASGITVNTADEWYGVEWYVFDHDPAEGDVFRISVVARGQELGFADLLIVDKVTGQVKNALGGDFVLLSETNGRRFLKIRFRIEEGAVGITVDARALTAAHFTIGDIGTFPTAAPVALDLAAGGYQVSAAEGSVVFSVTPAGAVAYEPALEGLLEGAGTPTLTLNGAIVQMTGPQLTTASGTYSIVNTGVFPTAAVSTLHVLPGTKRIQAAEGGAHVSVTQEGTFTYDPALEGILEGAGTSLLTMHGAAVQMTGPELTTASGSYSIVNTGVFPTAGVSTLHVLPGTKRIQAAEGGAHVSVTPEGTFTYDPALEGILAGAGTALLTMHGAAVQMTGPELTTASGTYSVVNNGVFPTAAVSTLHVLPGTKRIQAAEGGANVSVTQEGTFTYDPALEGILEGAGTSLLTMHGAAVQMTGPELTTASGSYLVVNNGVFPTDAVSTLHVLPGTKRIQAAEGGANVSVTQEGTFTYDPALEGIFEGAGTPLLAMHGATVLIDATNLSASDFSIINVGIFPTASAVLMHVLPGNKRFRSSVIDFDFQVLTNGLIDYDQSLDGALNGRNSATLTIMP